MLISRTGLSQGALVGQVAVITGAGGGIGYEAARALIWLGARVVIAEIDLAKGESAARALTDEFGPDQAVFIHTDVGDEQSVSALAVQAFRQFGKVDIVINNATIAQLGLVKDLPIDVWDASYRVNLRGPVLMARTFLPGMLERNSGVFACVSSTGTAYMGAYETFKAAQVHLSNTLDAELEGTGVIPYTIGPGLVPTVTATSAIQELAPMMGMSSDEFFENNQGAVISVEEAGVGFAASVVLAEQFRGQEISSIQVLKVLEKDQPGAVPAVSNRSLDGDQLQLAQELCQKVLATLREQADGWKQRSLFERQWVIRDFKKVAGRPVEQWLDLLAELDEYLQKEEFASALTLDIPVGRLADYYAHLCELARGYEKDPVKLEESLRYVQSWQADAESLQKILAGEM
jgi:NAD(P)-dependent dehydrogenase (short-subunit alcohol dehydrogenase family)